MIKKLMIIISSVLALTFFVTTPAHAAQQSAASKCGDTKTQLIACDSKSGIGAISDLIKIGITVLTVLIGIVATGGIAYGAIMYASARDNQSQVSEAIVIIRNIIIGLVLYGFTIAIINWLIPGGVIG